MSGAFSRQKPIQAARRALSDFEDVRSILESIKRGEALLLVSVYPWGLEFEVEAVETVVSDSTEDDASG